MAMRHKDFAVFILTHGRAGNMITVNTLRRQGYTGKIYLVIDNEDDQADEYYARYGDQVIMFDKAAVAETFDEGDNFQDRRSITCARNVSFQIAKDLGINYFMQLDDDDTNFDYRITDHFRYPKKGWTIRAGLDLIFDLLLDYYISIPALSIAIAQGGDFIGGAASPFPFGDNRRKCMNSFLCSVDRPYQFVGILNEDVNTYTTRQARGDLFLTVPFISLSQLATQSNPGGITELYLSRGTYQKAFTTVMFSPACVSVGLMKTKNPRLHHRVHWRYAVPQILPEKYRKAGV
jgi:hypothetical protein